MKKKPLILVIDSDKNIRWAFKNFLTKQKINMVGKSTAEEGLKILQEEDINLIVADIRANIKAGINFIREAKKIKGGIPIITTTSYPDKINSKILKQYGVEYFFVKPPDLNNLKVAITKCLKIDTRSHSENKYTI